MTFPSPRLAAAFLVGFALACGGDNRERGAPCDDSNACAVGLTCFDGACRAPCNLSTDCPEGTGCTGGLCVELATGTCGQSADCRAPPDACHTTFGARCLMGRCEYSRATTPTCREECTTAASCDEADTCQDPASARCVNTGCVYDPRPNGQACAKAGSSGVCYNGSCVDCVESADCDPRSFGYDLCYTGTCTNRVCSFAEIVPCDLDALGSVCAQDGTCRSGWCTDSRCCESRCDGVCADCDTNGRCDDVPADDSRCGNIECNGLDTVCRNYFDYSNVTGQRCASLGACVQPNSADCVLFQNASNAMVCRDATLECDVPELCNSGICPADEFQGGGSVCNPDPPPGEDDGRCDGVTPECRRLPVMPFVARYFIEEPSTGADRVDFFDNLPLASQGTGGISRVQASTGAGVAWASEASAYVYCAPLGTTDFSQTQMLLTFEAVVTIANGTSMPDSTIIFMGPAGTGPRIKLGVRRVSMDPAGQVTFSATFGDSTATYTWLTTIGAHAVVHLVFDGYQAAVSNVMRLFIDGIEVPRQNAGTAPSSFTLVDTDVLCIGNDMVAGSGAFAGSLWYAAVYDEDMTETEIMDAAIRLSISDE
ncbi:MAG: hypothetical protein ACAI38_24660 [Myxococcota bacterium]